MNPLTKIKLINELNAREASLGVKESVSWHKDYKDSAWIFIGGLPYELTEGDIICVFSQYGEVVNINLVRDKASGRSRGFCFICYEDQRSTVLAVDNFNGIKVKGRTIRVDHVANYRPPKDSDDIDDVTKLLREEGCGVRTPPRPPPSPPPSSEEEEEPRAKKRKKKKKRKDDKDKKSSKHKEKSEPGETAVHVKQERIDPSYDKYNTKESDCRATKDRPQELREDRDSRGLSRHSSYDRHRDSHRERDRHADGHRERDRYKESRPEYKRR
ncbi:RNA-binding motif protein, X-linked 2 [Spea bombifrons]|uniref:RNA-binding motif protein, X-linked 2 n=1 Tax=Spea bombifrons TaxID=233779 RepID=UPI00234B98E1|nr:RNA-binding motif protein, X-linked 2 [Spea bombifrons]